jgi:glycolate oxidase
MITERLLGSLRRIVGGDGVVSHATELSVYDCDGYTLEKSTPETVVLPRSTEEVAAVLKLLHAEGVPFVPRGTGTGLSGGCLPLGAPVMVSLTRMNRILELDPANRRAVVECGVINAWVSRAAKPHGLHYVPDPSSQMACSIGGNVAENSGGVHCLKYGVTTNNITGVEVVTMAGDVLRIGGRHADPAGYDLLGVITGSEGLLGVITEVTVKIRPKPECTRAALVGFPTIRAGATCVSRVISEGIIPAGMEMMDKFAIEAAEAFAHAGYPLDAESLLIVELDGTVSEVDDGMARVIAIARECDATHVRENADEAERERFWSGRKSAFPAMGRLSPDYICMDGTIPRGRLPDVLDGITALSRKHDLRVANVFHAGDGNLHPLILYDANDSDQLARAEAFGADILKLCVAEGGVLSGEHGIGVEKRDLMPTMFDDTDLKHQQRLKCAFDPDGLLNPGKMFPELHRCAELGKMHVHHGKLPFPHLPRF